MNIEEQVELLMQGTEYGDEELKKAMTHELRQRLLEAQNESRPLILRSPHDVQQKSKKMVVWSFCSARSCCSGNQFWSHARME